MEQLGGIGGVGEKKRATYGEGVVAVLAGLSAPGAAAAPEAAPAAAVDAATGAASASDAASDPAPEASDADGWPDEEPDWT